MLISHPSFFSPDSKRGNPMISSMLFASRIASNFSSWDVASVERRAEASTVFVRFGLKDEAPDRNLFPNLEGFRRDIAVCARPPRPGISVKRQVC